MATSAPPMPKRMYLAIRNPAFSREQFRMRWRQHGALAMSQASWKAGVVRYVHSDALPCGGGLLGATDKFDGAGTVYYRDADARKLRANDPSERPPILKDEEETFAGRVNPWGLVASERLLCDGSVGGIKAARYLWRRKNTTPAQFRDHWENTHANLVLGTPSVARHVRRYTQNDPLPPENGASWGLDCDGIEETWYENLDSLIRAHADPTYAAVIEHDRARFVGRCLLLLATDVVLYDTLDPKVVDGAVYPLAG